MWNNTVSKEFSTLPHLYHWNTSETSFVFSKEKKITYEFMSIVVKKNNDHQWTKPQMLFPKLAGNVSYCDSVICGECNSNNTKYKIEMNKTSSLRLNKCILFTKLPNTKWRNHFVCFMPKKNTYTKQIYKTTNGAKEHFNSCK